MHVKHSGGDILPGQRVATFVFLMCRPPFAHFSRRREFPAQTVRAIA